MKSVVVCSNCLGIINEYGACEHCLKAIIKELCPDSEQSELSKAAYELCSMEMTID